MWPWIAVARLFSNCRLAAFSTAFDLTAVRRLAVLDSAVAADAFWFRAVIRDDAFLLMFIQHLCSCAFGVTSLIGLAAPAAMTSPSCRRPFVATMERAVREAPVYVAAVYRAPIGLRAGDMSGHHFDMRSLMTTEGGRRLAIDAPHNTGTVPTVSLLDQSPIGRLDRA